MNSFLVLVNLWLLVVINFYFNPQSDHHPYNTAHSVMFMVITTFPFTLPYNSSRLLIVKETTKGVFSTIGLTRRMFITLNIVCKECAKNTD